MRSDRFSPLFGSLLLVAACGSDAPPAAPTPTPAAFVRVDIEGPTEQEIAAPGGTLQLRAVATMSDGTRPDVTGEAVWSVTDPRVLSVSPRGLVTGLAIGGTIVTASYRQRAGVTNVHVGPLGGLPFQVSGVVVDAESGAPIADADITQSGFEDEVIVLTRTDGNGFFNLGDRRGLLIFTVRKFGYASAGVRLDNVREPTKVDVRLTANPGPYIERRMGGTFPSATDTTETEAETATEATVRLSTRAGGLIDAMARAQPCASSGTLFRQVSGSASGLARGSSCEWARLRFVAAASDVQFTIRGYNATSWELVFREPR